MGNRISDFKNEVIRKNDKKYEEMLSGTAKEPLEHNNSISDIENYACKRRNLEKRLKKEHDDFASAVSATLKNKKNNEESRRIRSLKARKRAKNIAIAAVVLIVIGAVAFLAWNFIIHPNMSNDNLSTPEIIQTYSKADENGVVLITIESCDSQGNVVFKKLFSASGVLSERVYNGKIVSKKNNGNVEIQATGGEYTVQMGESAQSDQVTVKISKSYSKLTNDGENEYYTLSNGSAEVENIIDSADDLSKLMDSSEAYILRNDIDLSGRSWAPISNFSGTLLGNGFSIKNMTINRTYSSVGFFSTLKGTVMNLNFENAKVNVSGNNSYVGIVAGRCEGLLMDVSVSGEVVAETSTNVGGVCGAMERLESYTVTNLESSAKVTGASNVGGIFGMVNNEGEWNEGTAFFENLVNSGAVVGSGDNVGGIIGYGLFNDARGSRVVKLQATDFNNTGSVEGSNCVGGLFGYCKSNSSESLISNGENSSSVNGVAYVGCIAGQLEAVIVENCKNEGSSLTATGYIMDSGEKYAYVGGYVGKGFSFSNCKNTVEINYTGGGKYVGGICGYVERQNRYTMSKLSNTADISGESHVGGIFGDIICEGEWNVGEVSLDDFENSGTIKANADYAGGLIGYGIFNDVRNSRKVVLRGSNLKNTGAVEGNNNIGGLFGYCMTNSSDSFIGNGENASSVSGNAYVGCIAGQLETIRVVSCQNEGSTLTASGYIMDSGEKYAYVGGLVGKGYSFTECKNTVEINYTGGGKYVGGICGCAVRTGSCDMVVLENTVNISGASYVGGIFGAIINEGEWNEGEADLNDLTNGGSVKGSGDYVGGLIGYGIFNDVRNSRKIALKGIDLNNTGSVEGKNYVGGFFGYCKTNSSDSFIKGSKNKGSVNGVTYVGGIVGQLETIKIENCQNESLDITAKDMYVGGICGSLIYSGSYDMKELGNTANVNGKAYVGGIFGYLINECEWNEGAVNFDLFVNSGAIKGSGDYVGGLIGRSVFNDVRNSRKMILKVTNSKNSGSVNGKNYVGGLFGYCKTNSSDSSIQYCENTASVNGSSNVGKIAGKLENVQIK